MNTHCGSVRRKQRVPPQNTPYATHAYTSCCCCQLRDDSSAPCTRPPIFNQRPHPSQSTTINNQVAYYSVANPIEYPQEKALLPPAPLNKCPPTQITSSARRQTGQVEERSKEINPLQHAQPNRIQLTCPPCNRPTLIDRPCVGHHAERGAKDPPADNKWPQIECPKLPCCCYNVPTHTTICRRRQSSPEHSRGQHN